MSGETLFLIIRDLKIERKNLSVRKRKIMFLLTEKEQSILISVFLAFSIENLLYFSVICTELCYTRKTKLRGIHSKT